MAEGFVTHKNSKDGYINMTTIDMKFNRLKPSKFEN